MMLKKQIWILVLSLAGFGVALSLSSAAMGHRVINSDRTSSLIIADLDSANPQTFSSTGAQEVVTNDEPVNTDSSRILLWLAFLIALVIFSASVIGAIRLYSRRRPLK